MFVWILSREKENCLLCWKKLDIFTSDEENDVFVKYIQLGFNILYLTHLTRICRCLNMTSPEELKLQKVLELFLIPDYNIVRTTYLDLLLMHIGEEIKKENQVISQITQNWIFIALNTWNENLKPCQNVSIFTIKLIGLMSENESIFMKLCQNNVHKKTCSVFDLEKKDLSASMKMAFTTFFINLLEHCSGRQWIAETGTWKEILRFAQLNHTMYVTRESKKFLSVFLVQESHNRKLCEEIILAVTEPLINATLDSQVNSQLCIIDKNVLFDQNNLLLTTLDLLLAILDYASFCDLVNPIPAMFEELTALESRVNVVFEVSISTPFMKTVHKLSKLLIFTKLRSSLEESHLISEKVFEQFCLGLCYNSTMLLSKKYILDLVISKKLGLIYWKRLNKLKKMEVPKPYKVENQAIALMILPLCVTMKPKYMKVHYLFEEFMEKLFAVTCTPVQRLAYSIRDVICKNDFPMEFICKSTVDHLLEIVDIMDRESAVIVFQTLCHALKNFIAKSEDNSNPSMDSLNPSSGTTNVHQLKKKVYRHFLDGDPINDKRTLLAALLNGLNVLTEKFKLKWQECVETICVLSIAQDILNHPGVDSKICTLALKTCKLSIENFMPPNLALLVDFDDHTREIGPTLFKRIHDANWEVQDSVLEILKTIACLSENKYPPYQNFLLENHFLQVAVDIAKNDSESYVRASALTFISTAVRINSLWDKLLSQLNLLDLAMKLVYTENEAIVRREAVILIKELYVYRKWQRQMVNSMSQAMTVAAVLDLHWEVKINALEFWRHFIKSHLTDQGMLDGHFPTVTFSKEHRKIMSLDETEIKHRLNKTLDELARQRCLGVLLVALNDESDLEVSKTSADIISELRRLLVKYKIHETTVEVDLSQNCTINDMQYEKEIDTDSGNGRDASRSSVAFNVIEEIVDASDANLLASIYRNSMKMDDNYGDYTSHQTFEYIETVKRADFLKTIFNFDFESYIKERSEWLQNYTNSFDSVLDDILIVNDRKDVNIMDCY